MRGSELIAWRELMGFSQLDLMKELGVKSRQTISSWENSEEIPRIVALAIKALEFDPNLREWAGKATPAKAARKFNRQSALAS